MIQTQMLTKPKMYKPKKKPEKKHSKLQHLFSISDNEELRNLIITFIFVEFFYFFYFNLEEYATHIAIYTVLTLLLTCRLCMFQLAEAHISARLVVYI